MTAAPTHSGPGYKVGLICAVDATELAVTAILDDVHPTFTSRVDSASMAPSAYHENCVLAFKPTGQAGKWWLQRTDTNQNMEGVLYRDEPSGEIKGLCFEMEAVHHINELACAVTGYLSDLHSRRSEHQYAEMGVARIIEMLPDVRKIVPVRVAKSEDDTAGTRVEFADISAATQASYVIDMDSPQYISYRLNSGVRSTSNDVRQRMCGASSNSHRTARFDFIPCEVETATEVDVEYS